MRILHNKELRNLNSTNIGRMIKSGMILGGSYGMSGGNGKCVQNFGRKTSRESGRLILQEIFEK
jgi:hypothetical protein